MDNNDNQTDDFQQNPDEANQTDDLYQAQKLPSDSDTPFSPPDGVQDRIDDTHPSTDTSIDSHERYDEGIEGAANIELPGQAADEAQDPPRDLV